MVELFELIDLQTISMVSAAIGILIGILNWIKKSGAAEKQRQIEIETRQAQLFMELMDKFSSKEGIEYMRLLRNATWSSYEEWLERYRNDVEYDNAYRWISSKYDGVGALLREGLLDVRMVALVATSMIIYHWEKHKGVIYDYRKRRNDRNYHGEWEYLYNTIMKYLEEHPELAP